MTIVHFFLQKSRHPTLGLVVIILSILSCCYTVHCPPTMSICWTPRLSKHFTLLSVLNLFKKVLSRTVTNVPKLFPTVSSCAASASHRITSPYYHLPPQMARHARGGIFSRKRTWEDSLMFSNWSYLFTIFPSFCASTGINLRQITT